MVKLGTLMEIKNTVAPITVAIMSLFVLTGNSEVIIYPLIALVQLVCNVLLSLISLVGSIVYYLLVFVLLLIPQLTVLGVLSYKSKSDNQSFNNYIDNLMKIIEVESKNEKGSTYLADRLLNWAMFKFNFMVAKQSLLQNTYFYDLGVFNVAMVRHGADLKKRIIFIGTFGTWFPVYFKN